MRILILALCLTFAGCGGSDNSGADDEEDKETVFDPLVGNIDKAKNVEDQLMQHKDRTDQAIAESELADGESEDDSED